MTERRTPDSPVPMSIVKYLFGIACLTFSALPVRSAELPDATGGLPARIYDEAQMYTVPQASVVFHTHPSPDYDCLSASLAGNRNLNRILQFEQSRLRQAGMPVPARFLVLDYRSKNDEDYYIQPAEVDGVVHSIGGSHNLTFPNAAEFIFTGGIFERCLCESLRDAIKGAEAGKRDFSSQPLKIVFITDGIYLVPGANDIDAGAEIPYSKQLTSDANLANALAYLADELLIENLSTHIFNIKDDRICKSPGSNKLSKDNNPKMSSYTVTVVRNSSVTGKIGTGKQRIRAIFMTSQEYGDALKMERMPRVAQ